MRCDLQGARFRGLVVAALAAMASAWVLSGCGPSSGRESPALGGGDRGGAPVEPITNYDACATRLHEICGPLLLYYAANHRLPADIEALRDMPGSEAIADFVCPVSRQPYVYEPLGLPAPGSAGGSIILYDPAPSHSHMRWAISIIEPTDAGSLVTKVVAIPETYFLGR